MVALPIFFESNSFYFNIAGLRDVLGGGTSVVQDSLPHPKSNNKKKRRHEEPGQDRESDSCFKDKRDFKLQPKKKKIILNYYIESS